MLKGRRIGTFTAGISLVAFGVLFLVHIFNPALNYRFIFTLWPVILILLGLEIIISSIINRNEKLRYDGGAIALVIIIAVFAMFMGGMEFIFENAYLLNDGIRLR